jgi:amino acid adenylation domain-containing protein
MLFHEFLLDSTEKSKVIVKTIDGQFTCNDLISFSEIAARSLAAEGVGVGDRVILLMENGLNALVAQLSCSRVGAIFIPVSPQEPVTRIDKIIKQVTPALIICNQEPAFEFELDVPIKTMENGLLQTQKIGRPPVKIGEVSEDDILYIISTSGTTGEPKGIAMSHKATIEFFRASVAHCGLAETDNVGSIAPLQFDFSILDLGLALGSGACLTILPQALAYQPKKLINVINEKRVTQLNSVPSVWSMIINYSPDLITTFTCLKSILYAGERFPVKNIRFIREKLPQLRIINCFGQSESIACSFFDLENPFPDQAQDISFGKGFPGNIFYIIGEDSGLITLPDTVGELWVSNQSLFTEYWGNPDETASRLIADPFDKTNTKKVFRSGDLVYRDSYNNFFFVSRKDNQIKVKGNRVELDEIAQCLNNHEKVNDVLPIAEIKGNDTSIMIFLSPRPGCTITAEEIRKYCRLNLPSYMVPEEIIIKESLPVTINGKINKKMLIDEYQLALKTV